MDELTLKIDYCEYFNKEFENYLFLLQGVYKVIIDYSENEIYIKYDSKIISIEILKKEILLFLSLLEVPSIVAFDKHSKNKVISYSMIIKNLCCEYCLKNMIEELLLVRGIESAFSNFDYNNKKDVVINIEYDNSLIKKEEIIRIENDYNS